jgi:recombination protein RecA
MRVAVSKAEIESEIAGRFGDAFKLQEKVAAFTISSGIPELDALIGGVPRGAISEIFGPASSGRTSLMTAMLAYATTHEEICALVDTNDVFAPTAAVASDIDFERLLWVRCAANIEHAFKAADLLLHAGGFGLVVLDLGDVPGKDARRIISSWWYRFRRTVENKPTALLVMAEESCTRSCASLTLELRGAAEWAKEHKAHNVLPLYPQKSIASTLRLSHANLLRGNSIKIKRHRPITMTKNEVQFKAKNFLLAVRSN